MTKINDEQKKAAEKRSNDGSKKGKKRSAFSRKKTSDTFWNLLRVENHMTLEDVAEYTGFKLCTLSAWFTGRYMPQDWQIKILCDMFDIPFERGKLEMENAYTTYHGAHGTIEKEPRKAPKSVVEDVKKFTIKKEPEVTVYEDNNNDYVDVDGIMRILFDELTYDEYESIKLNGDVFKTKDEVLKKLFDLVSWEAYEKIRAILG